MLNDIYISLGSNIEPHRHLRSAAQALALQFDQISFSPVYRSPAIGMQGDEFLNAVAMAQTRLAESAIVEMLKNIEDRHGRDRGKPKFSSRTLDLDLLLYAPHKPCNTSPPPAHPEISQQAYVVKPLADIAPNLIHPPSQLTIEQLCQRMQRDKPKDFQQLYRVDDSLQEQLLER